jgi:hypothetical protein
MTLPAAIRRRWGLKLGGTVAYIDLGDSLLLVPGGVQRMRRELLSAITPDIWRQAEQGFGDPDLANE